MLEAFSVTDIGKRRKLNQDYVFSSERPLGNLPNLFIVADGMGGHNAGDYASKYTVETVVQEVMNMAEDDRKVILQRAIDSANAHIRQKAKEDDTLCGMGTTLVVATCIENTLEVANIGDSRLYIMNSETIRQITTDHSLVEEMIRMGGIDREAARSHPDKNIITRAIGAQDEVRIDFFEVDLHKGDIVLMCSDGLTNMLEDEDIRMIMSEHDNIAGKAEALVEAANENGGKDNIAVIVIEPFVDEVNK